METIADFIMIDQTVCLRDIGLGVEQLAPEDKALEDLGLKEKVHQEK